VVHELETKFARYAGYIPQFSEHNNAMQTFNLWTALELEGLGCNVAHYNPYIDQRIVAEWGVPATWSLKAQLTFGAPAGPPNPNKTFKSVDERIIVHGAKD
jgi:predicted oxidoreductase (fatty acid repression mutant protein)